MPIPSLPNELVDHILSYGCLKEKDLVETCLVSKSWLEPSRKSLYLDIVVVLYVVKAAPDNPYRPGPTNYLDEASVKLFSLLTQRPELAAMAKRIKLFVTPHDLQPDRSNVSTTHADLLSSLLRLLPSATYLYLQDDKWFQPDNVGYLFPYFHQFQALYLEEISGTRWFDLVKQLPNLKSLKLMWVDTEDLQPSSSTPALGITDLHQLTIQYCGPVALADLPTESWPSLLSLTIDLALVPQLNFSLCPEITQLSIKSSDSQLSYLEIKPFLKQLKTSEIVKLSLSANTVGLFDQLKELHLYIPKSCQRIDLFEALDDLSLDGVAAVAQTHVAQLGLVHPSKGGSRLRERTVTILAALRAMVDGTGIEIIWR